MRRGPAGQPASPRTLEQPGRPGSARSAGRRSRGPLARSCPWRAGSRCTDAAGTRSASHDGHRRRRAGAAGRTRPAGAGDLDGTVTTPHPAPARAGEPRRARPCSSRLHGRTAYRFPGDQRQVLRPVGRSSSSNAGVGIGSSAGRARCGRRGSIEANTPPPTATHERERPGRCGHPHPAQVPPPAREVRQVRDGNAPLGGLGEVLQLLLRHRSSPPRDPASPRGPRGRA